MKIAGRDTGRIGLGCMGMTWAYGAAERDEAESIATIHRALELGVTLLDTADMYGPFTNEELVGRAIEGRRDEVVLATKCGLVVEDEAEYVLGKDGRPEHVREAIDGSLRRLRTDFVDLYQLHRVDPEVPLEETWGALAELVAAGKVGAIGLSEVSVDELERAHAIHPVASVQSEGLAVDPRRVRRGGPVVRRPRRRVPPVRAAGPRLPDRRADVPDVPAGRLPQEQPALPARGDGRQPRRSSRPSRRSRPAMTRPRPRSRSPGCSPRASTSSRSRAPSAARAWRRTPPRRRSPSAP